MTMKKQNLKPKESIKFGHYECLDALRWVDDMLIRSQTPYVLLGDTAMAVKEEIPFELDHVEVGVQKRHFTQDTTRLFNTCMLNEKQPLVTFDNDIKLIHHGVPITIKVVKKHWDFLQNQDFAFYFADEYNLPNPWDKYVKSRGLVR